MRVAFIGAGRRALQNAGALLDSGAGEVAGFWSRTVEARARSAAHFKSKSFPSIEALVRDSGCDVVSISTHPAYRAEPVERCIAFGAQFVVLEKPIGMDAATLLRIEEAAGLVPVVANTQYQWMPHWQHILKNISAGSLGELRWTVATSAVDALDQGPHALSLAFAAAHAAGYGDRPEWVLAGASGLSQYGGVNHPAELSATFGVGPIRVQLLAGMPAPAVPGETNQYYQQQLDVIGTEGSAWVSLNQGGHVQTAEGMQRLHAAWPQDDRLAQGAFWLDVADAARDPLRAARFPTRIHVAAAHQRALLAAYRSASEGVRISLAG